MTDPAAEPRIAVEDRGATRILTLDRPDKKNAFDIGQARGLKDALEAAAAADGVRVIVVTGAGDAFSAGADMNTFAGRDPGDPADIYWVGHLHEPLRACGKPLIAAVNGLAVGMGVTLLPFFDLVYAAESATFATLFVRLGLVLEYGSSWTLPRLIGRQRASEMILRGSPVDAATAERWGLVNRIFPDAELMPRVREIADEIAANGPRAVRASKRLLRDAEGPCSFADAFAAEQEVLATCYGSEEHMAQVTAFLERKRKP